MAGSKENHERQVIAELNQGKRDAIGGVPAGTGFAPQKQRTNMSRVLSIKDSIPDVEAPGKPKPDPEPVPAATKAAAAEPETKAADPAPQPAVQAGPDVAKMLQEMMGQLKSLAETNAELKQEVEAAKQAAEEKQSQAQLFEDLSKLVGKGADEIKMPGVNTLLKTGRDKLDGLIGEAMSVRESCSPAYRRSEQYGSAIPVYDASELDHWVAEQMQERGGKRTLLKEMDRWAKAHGLFQGNRITQDATTGADVPGGFLEILSSVMRMSNRPGYVFWQLPTTVHNFGRGEGEVVKVPRNRYPTRPTDPDDRLLSGSGTYVRIDSGNVPVTTGVENFILKEYGRGRPDAPPIAVPTFVGYNSMIDLYPLLESNLLYDYFAWEDLIIRQPLGQASTVLYNNGGDLAVTAATVASDGQMSREFLGEIYTAMSLAETVPLDPEGNYGIVLNTKARGQFKKSLDSDWEAPSPEELERLTNLMLAQYPQGENLQISGYLGNYEGFHIWSSNAFASGPAATDPLVEVETTTAASATNATFRESFAFGGGALGRAVGGTGMQIVFDETTDFGRNQRAIWHCYEAHGALDVDPDLSPAGTAVPQEQRVWRIRTSDTALVAA